MLVTLDGGVMDNPAIDPTVLPNNVLQSCVGAEYRVGSDALWTARGRTLRGDVGAVTNRAIYTAGFDTGGDRIIIHEGDNIHDSAVATGLSFVSLGSVGTGSLPITGTFVKNRHYVATGTPLRALELLSTVAGVTHRTAGMERTGFQVGVSVTQGTSTFSATTGLTYWLTEYDPTRGIESTFGNTANTGAFSLKDSVVLSITGTSSNQNSEQIRIYRSLDGGAWPTGSLLATIAITASSFTDRAVDVSTLLTTRYGIVSTGDLDFERDVVPPPLSVIGGPFQDSLLGVDAAEGRVVRFTPAGFYESWPTNYGIPLDLDRCSQVHSLAVLPGRVGAFTCDSIHVIFRLPRDADSVFATGEVSDVLTKQRGSVSRRGVAVIYPAASDGALVVFVAHDGIWATTLYGAPFPLTDGTDWSRVNRSELFNSVLRDDFENRRLVFIYRKATDTTHNTGIMYLDYQRRGFRITHGDHGALVDGGMVHDTDGVLRMFTADSRASNGQVYAEAQQDADASLLVDTAGSIVFKARTKEFMPAGAEATIALGKNQVMHGDGPATLVAHRFYHDRRDSNPEVKMRDWSSRECDDIELGKTVNSVSIEVINSSNVSWPIHWMNIEGIQVERKDAVKGA